MSFRQLTLTVGVLYFALVLAAANVDIVVAAVIPPADQPISQSL